MTQNAPEIIKQAKWVGIKRWGKQFKVVSRIAVIFENSEPDQLEWNTAVAIGAAFSQQFAGAVMHNHAGRAWKV